MLKFSEDHEWAKFDNIVARLVFTACCRTAWDIVFVELPEIGTKVEKGDAVAVFESVKAASDIYSPAAGEIIEVNGALLDDLTSITPENAMENWLFKIKINDVSDLESLMDEGAYNALIG